MSIDFAKLSKPTLTELGYQICFVCSKRYSKTREGRPLPCGHHFCVPCVMGEIQKMKRARAEAGFAKGGFAEDGVTPFSPSASTEANQSNSKSFEVGANGLYATPSKSKSASKLTNTPDEFPLLLGCPLCEEMHDITGW